VAGLNFLCTKLFWQALLIAITTPIAILGIAVLLVGLNIPIEIASVVIIALVLGALLLLSCYCDWFDDITGDETMIFPHIQDKWNGITDPYYKGKNSMSNVPILYYKKVKNGYKEILTNTVDYPLDINWYDDCFNWQWIEDSKCMGWKQERPITGPAIMMSKGMKTHVERILTEAKDIETAHVTAENPFKNVKTMTKSSTPA
jgi:hypothetical protein